MDNTQSKVFDEDSVQIDESEEEALLKSDEELEAARTSVSLNVLRPPSTVNLIEDNSLMNDTAELDNGLDAEDQSLDEEISKAGTKAIDLTEGNGENDDDDEDDYENNEEIKSLNEFQSILTELDNNPYAYDKYVRLCELSHSTSDLHAIRLAYTTFASVYPLTPELWQNYLSVEINIAQSENEISEVNELFRKALKDYYSCDVAMEWANFIQRCPLESVTIWQELLGTYGLNCYKGREFFELYRQQFTSGLRDLSESDNKAEYINSYLRELQYPLYGMEETYIEFKVLYEKNKDTNWDMELDWQEIDAKYFKAKEHLKKIFVYEEKLEALEANAYREKAEIYFEYIKVTDKYLDENILQTIYERMVAECCLNAECWIRYIDFIDYRDEFEPPKELQSLPLFRQTPDDICQRALRNCTWSAELYIKRMQIMEKMDEPKNLVQKVIESVMAAGFQTPEPVVAVWLEYLTYLRRNTDWSDPNDSEILRKNFDMAWTVLGRHFGVLADCNCEILQFWGRLEYGPLQDSKKGKELWSTVMESADNASKSGLWIEFILLEMRRDLNATRKLFSKALNSVGLDNPFVIAAAWERFERCNGTVESLNNCIKECKRFKLQFAETSFTKPQKVNVKATKRKVPLNEANESPPAKQTKVVDEKPTASSSTRPRPLKEKESAFKDHENQEIDLSKDHLRIFLSNLDYNLSEQDIRDGLSEVTIASIELIRSANGRSRGFGYAELATEADVEKALTLDRKELNGRPVFISSVLRDKEKRQKFKYAVGMEPTKLFVKGLPLDVTQEELKEIFKEFGPIKDVRLVHHKSGKFKQIAYVEYQQETSAGRAVLALDKMDLRGHTIIVAISAPPPKPSTNTSVNPIKLLGISNKRSRNQFEQKPRMSLVPMAVRKNLAASTNSTTVKESLPGTTSASVVSKSNEDFRKLLNK